MRSGPAPFDPLTLGSSRPGAPLALGADLGVELPWPARDAHEPPGGRLGSHRVAPALSEPLRCHLFRVGERAGTKFGEASSKGYVPFIGGLLTLEELANELAQLVIPDDFG